MGHLALLSSIELYAFFVRILQLVSFSKYAVSALHATESPIYRTFGFCWNLVLLLFGLAGGDEGSDDACNVCGGGGLAAAGPGAAGLRVGGTGG